MKDDDTTPAPRPYKIDLSSKPEPPPPPPQITVKDQIKQAPATSLFIGLNTAIFLAQVALTKGEAFIDVPTALNVAWGANYGPLTLSGEYFRVLTCMFLHGGILHIAMNMYVLWDVGTMIERFYGTSKFVVIYLLAGLGGSVTSLYFNPAIPSVGASGAVFGAYGALLALLRIHQSDFEKAYLKVATRAVIFLVIFNLVWGFSRPDIDNAAHIGGFVFGLLSGVVVAGTKLDDKKWRFANIIGCLVLMGMIWAVGYGDYLAFVGR